MTRALAARVKRLEQRSEPPRRIQSAAVYFDPETDRILTPQPLPKKIMLVPRWASDEAWAEAAIEQQTRLINSAA
ncbi:hypothetical protein VK792_19305 [Mesobacterium sp. TK19101]|uniref:Uncharacterized protein n=1 Tax=Mesobacterium hydrothermale TaxID=3111907 RepID=A0ABU6HLV1_9RHOB|nr:hypothetical protein [Mesobacterium sp. TK19101]MEC3863433.1 hypothetical protein [Mesobacterium sp. TK19101]